MPTMKSSPMEEEDGSEEDAISIGREGTNKNSKTQHSLGCLKTCVWYVSLEPCSTQRRYPYGGYSVSIGADYFETMSGPYNTSDMVATFYPRGATVFASVCAVAFSIIGMVGNLITTLALIRSSKLRQHATTAFVISLCISDLMFCSINLPLTASRYISEAWVLSPTLCKIFPFFFYGNVAVSLLSMVAITLNRYILISCHKIYDKLYSGHCVCLMLVFIWGFSFSMMVPPLIEAWGRLGLDPPTFSCTILKKDGRSPKKLLFMLGFLLPCVVIIISYTCIYWKVQQSRKNLQSHNLISSIPAVNVVPSTTQFLQRRDDIRLTRLMLTIFCCFLMCFLPLMLVNVADDEIKYPTVHVLASVLAWASSVVNPFIYAASNRQYRAAYHELLCSSQSNKNRRNGQHPGLAASSVYLARYPTGYISQGRNQDPVSVNKEEPQENRDGVERMIRGLLIGAIPASAFRRSAENEHVKINSLPTPSS